LDSNQEELSAKLASLPKEQTAAEVKDNQPSMELMNKIQDLKEKYKEDPKNFENNKKLGNSYYDLGRFDLAIDYYRKAVRLNNKQPEVLVDLGVSYFNISNADSAVFFIKEALKIQPDQVQALFNLGIIYYNIKQLQSAKASWESLLLSHPGSKEAQLAKGYLETLKSQIQ